MKPERYLKPVQDLFSKYKNNLIAPEASVISAFVEVVEDVLSIKIPPERVRYNPQTKTLAITGQAALKSEIKLHQEEIINHLKGRLGAKNAPQTIL